MTDREFLIHRNILRSLRYADGLLVLSSHLREDVGMATPQLTQTEFVDALDAAEGKQLVTSVRSERGMKYKISDQGRAWLSENSI